MSAPPVTGPHDVPNLRLYLLDRWRVGGVYEQATKLMRRQWTLDGDVYGWRPREESDWQRMHLGDELLTLWWVSAEMVDEINHVAAMLPDDVRPLEVPGLVMAFDEDGEPAAAKGLVVLEKPIVGRDARNQGGELLVDAFAYGGTQLPPLHGKPARKAVSVSTYRHSLPEEGIGEEWLPLGRSDWPMAERLVEPIDYSVNEVQLASMVEDRRWLAALHLVADDHRVATVRRVEPTRKEQRRPSERRKLSPAVRVLYLRQLDEEGEGDGRTATGRRAPRAHIVRSHPRWQAYGPQRSERKLILVPRHARGHGGEPTEGPPTVKAIV